MYIFILFAVHAVALNSRLEAQYGLLGHGGHLFPPRRVLFHNMVLEHLATATMDGISASLGRYTASLDGDLDPRDLVQSRRLETALRAALHDVRQMQSAFEHERGRSQDTSRFGFRLAVEEFERPAPTASEDAVRMDYVLRQAKRDSGGPPPPHVPQTQTPRQGGGGGSGFWQKRKQQKKAEKAKGSSGKAPFVGYSGVKNAKKKN